jgi:predicted aminopeptidase
MKKRSFLLIVIALAWWQWDWLTYFYMQAKGGLKVAFDTRPIVEVMADSQTPDSLKARIRLIDEIKRFAIDSLGLNDIAKNYRTLHDQHGKPLVYVLVVSEKYQLKPIQWDFPLIGSFDYKGFFDLDRAKLEKTEWDDKGYDTRISEASAYSTLGYLPEPILSSMLWRSDGQLANLIMHEMTHSTAFIKDNHELNENLANFVGDYGAERFLIYKFGKDAEKLKVYQQKQLFYDVFARHVNRGTQKLDSLYRTFRAEDSSKQRDSLKYQLITTIALSEDTLYRHFPNLKFRMFDKNKLPNNAFFVGFSTYHAKQDDMKRMFNEQFQGDFHKFISYWKKKVNSF